MYLVIAGHISQNTQNFSIFLYASGVSCLMCSRTSRVTCPRCSCALRTLVPNVICFQHALVPHVPRAVRALVSHMSRALRVFVSHLSCTLDALMPLIPQLLQVSHSWHTLKHLIGIKATWIFLARTTVNHYDMQLLPFFMWCKPPGYINLRCLHHINPSSTFDGKEIWPVC